jgi:tetratricopeptide (TPR) repeat protein
VRIEEMMRLGIGAVLTLAVAAPLAAQQPAAGAAPASLPAAVANEMFAAAGGKLVTPSCKADEGLHFKTKSGKTYLKTAIETPLPENKARALENGSRVIREAIAGAGQGNSAGAWYYLGAVQLFEGDVAAADSALARAEQLAPDCKAAIEQLRAPAYSALFNWGVTHAKAERSDSALHYFKLASRFNPRGPEAPYSIAGAMYNQGKFDSAAVYFRRALEAAQSPEKAKLKEQAQYNYAVTLLKLEKHKEAVPLLQEYTKSQPDDMDAKKLLMTAYRGAGMADSARVIEQQVVAAGGAAGGPAAGAAAGAGASDLLSIGATAYQEKRYAEAATAFSKALETDPYNRGALYNLANTYLVQQDGPNLVKTAQRILALEPMSEWAMKAVRQGHLLAKQSQAASKAAERALPMPVDVTFSEFRATPSGASVTLVAKGRAAMTVTGKPVAPAPMNLTVEFLDEKGTPVATQAVSVPALKAGVEHTAPLQGQGSGIAGVRYRKAEKTSASK